MSLISCAFNPPVPAGETDNKIVDLKTHVCVEFAAEEDIYVNG